MDNSFVNRLNNVYYNNNVFCVILYYGDYLADGMTNNVFKMAMNNINCYIYEKKRLQAENLSLKHEVINTVKYINYSILAKKDYANIIDYSENKILTTLLYLPVSLGLSPYRQKKLKSIKK